MIEGIIEFSIRRRWLVVLAAALLALWGIRSIAHIPIDAIPDVSENQVLVFTDWTGHAPREIEDQVTYPLALELQGLAGVRVVRSSSDVGYSLINVIFDDSVGWDAARRHVGDALTRRPQSAARRRPAPRSRRRRHGANLLVHARRRRLRSRPIARGARLVRPTAACRSPRRR